MYSLTVMGMYEIPKRIFCFNYMRETLPIVSELNRLEGKILEESAFYKH